MARCDKYSFILQLMGRCGGATILKVTDVLPIPPFNICTWGGINAKLKILIPSMVVSHLFGLPF